MKNERAIFIALLLLIFICSVGVMLLIGQNKELRQSASMEEGIQIGERAPRIKAKTIDGKDLELGNGPMLLAFFNTSCPGCRDGMPILNNRAIEFKRKGIPVIGITPDSKTLVRKLLNNARITDLYRLDPLEPGAGI